MTTRRLFLAALTTLGVAAATPASAAALKPVWQTPMVASNPGADIFHPRVLAAPDGSLAIIWQQSDGSDLRVAAKTRSAAGVWSDAEFITDPIAGGYIGSVLAGVAGDGSFTVGWMRADYSAQLLTIKQPDSPTWRTNTQAPDAGEYFTGGALTAGPDNSTVFLTTGGVGGDKKLRVRQRPAGSDDLTVIGEIDQPDGDNLSMPKIAFNEDGDAVAAWKATPPSADAELRVARYDRGTDTWSSPTTVGTEASGFQDLAVAINDAGKAAVIWTSGDTSNVKAAALDGDSGTTTLLDAGPNTVLPNIAADDDGQFVALWQEFDYGHLEAGARSLSRTYSVATDSWSSAQSLASVAGGPNLAANPSGDMVASFVSSNDGVHTMLGVAYRESGSDSFDAMQIADTTIEPGNNGIAAVALDAAGNASVAYPVLDGSARRVNVVAGDGAAPSLSNISVPSSATAGDTVSFSSSSFDLWSGLGATTWEFGDGDSATGSSVQHVYAAAGTYTVRVTSTDLAGYSGSETRQITVAPAPAPPVLPITPKPPVLAPVIEARLSGKTITLTAKVGLRSGKSCSGKATATTSFGNTTYRTTLTLKKVGKDCVGTGVIKLKKAPSTRTKLRVTVSSKSTKTRTITTKRG